MRLPPPGSASPSTQVAKWSPVTKSNNDERQNRSNGNERQIPIEMQRNTLGDFLQSNHDVMTKIMKFDMAARQQAAMQMPYIAQEESIDTVDDIRRSQGRYDDTHDDQRHGPAEGSADSEEREQPPTPKTTNNNLDRKPPPRVPPSVQNNMQRNASPNPFLLTNNSMPKAATSPMHMAPPRASIAASYNQIQRQPSPNPSISADNTMGTMYSSSRTASPRTTMDSHSHVLHQQQPSPNPSMPISATNTMSTMQSRAASPRTTFASYSQVRHHQQPSPNPSISTQHTMHSTSTRPPILFESQYSSNNNNSNNNNNNIEMGAGNGGVNPQADMYYNTEQAIRESASRSASLHNAGGKSTTNPATVSYYNMQRGVPPEPMQQHQHTPATATTSYYYSMEQEDHIAPMDAATYNSFEPPQNPAFPAAMCYNGNFGGNPPAPPPPTVIQGQFASTPDWGAFKPAPAASTPKKSLADDALRSQTSKSAKRTAAPPTSRALKTTSPPSMKKNQAKDYREASKCSSTSSSIFDFMKASLLKKPATMCGPGPIVATMSGEEESREKKPSSLWSILDPTEDLDYTDDDDTYNSSPTRAKRDSRATKKAPRDRSRQRSRSRGREASESPSRRGSRSGTQSNQKENDISYRKAYDDLMFMNSSTPKRDNETSGRERRDSRKSPRTVHKDSPLKGSHSVHYSDERENTRSTRRKTSLSKHDDPDIVDPADSGHKQSSRQRRRDTESSRPSLSDETRRASRGGTGLGNSPLTNPRTASEQDERTGTGHRVRVTVHSTPPTPKRSHRDRDRSARRDQHDEIYSDGSDDEVAIMRGGDVPIRSRSRSADHKSRLKKREELSDDETDSPQSSPRRPSGRQNETKSPARRAKSALRESRYTTTHDAPDEWEDDNPRRSSAPTRARQLPEELPRSGKRVIVTGGENRHRKSKSSLSKTQTGPIIDVNFGADSRVSALSLDGTLSAETRLLRRQLNKVMCRSVKKDRVLEHSERKSQEISRGIPARLPGAHSSGSFDSATSDTSPSFAYPVRKREKDALEEAYEQCLTGEFLEHPRIGPPHGGPRRLDRRPADTRGRRVPNVGSSPSSASSAATPKNFDEEYPVEDEGENIGYDGHYMYVAFSRFGEDAKRVIQLCEHASMPVSNARGGEVLIKVMASTVSATDCEVRRGEWSEVRLTPFIIPGVAFVGRIHKTEKRSAFQSLQPGDLVMSLVKSGSNARFLCAPRDQLVKVPNDVDPSAAVCLTETYLSAFQALHLGQKSGIRYRANSLKGRSILVLGGATALGVALIELALAGGTDQVYATAREKQFENVSNVGAIPLSRDPQDWLTLIGNKISTIVCVDTGVHAESVTREHLKALNKEGQVVAIGAPGIERTAINMNAASPSKLMCVSGKNKLRDRSQYYNVFDQWAKDTKLCKRDLTHLLELLQKRAVCPDILERISLAKVAKAQSIVETKRLSGFIVCDPWLIKEKLI